MVLGKEKSIFITHIVKVYYSLSSNCMPSPIWDYHRHSGIWMIDPYNAVTLRDERLDLVTANTHACLRLAGGPFLRAVFANHWQGNSQAKNSGCADGEQRTDHIWLDGHEKDDSQGNGYLGLHRDPQA